MVVMFDLGFVFLKWNPPAADGRTGMSNLLLLRFYISGDVGDIIGMGTTDPRPQGIAATCF